MIVFRLAWQSLANRWLTAMLTILAIAFSVMLLLGVEKVRTGARQSFADTISGTDLIIGARSGALNLLLYSVFRIGNATNNITWTTYQEIAQAPDIDWIVPISLGDSHHGFRVMGTTPEYFARYRYRRTHALEFAQGKPFADLFDAVIGADVAAKLGYKLGDRIVVAHGLGSTGFVEHDDKPFQVSGILAKTGTPVDRTVHVSLEAIEAIHIDWQSGARIPGQSISADEVRKMPLPPKAITAALIGLKSKLGVFRLQRAINEYRAEPLSAILPGSTLQELWSLVGTAETALAAVSVMVVVTALLGMVTMILTTLNERRREMAILRSVGARPGTILGLLVAEAALLIVAGVGLGIALLYAALFALQPYIDRVYGLYIAIEPLKPGEWTSLAAIVFAGILTGLLPAFRAYRLSLADGMTVRT
ncbi:MULTISPECIES: ABC transporter permease [Rhodomicrobium]|uniref:ABC transporter permease n=1 Tax=Rhodomicrobium TaxID=1068 RepID=UPI000B4A5D0B|nr:MULTISPECIES: ABC transporter permease [Rhodomicrobium]